MIVRQTGRPQRKGQLRHAKTRRVFASTFTLLLSGLLLTGCGDEQRHPAMGAANWSNYEITDRETVGSLLESWLVKAKATEGVFVVLDGMNMADARTPMRITHANGWRSIRLTGQRGSWENRALGSQEKPVTVWVKDMIPGEQTSDIVICDQKVCTDVTAWYVLANFNEQLSFPEEVAELIPQDAAEISRLGNSDPYIIEFYLDHIDDEVTGSVTTETGIERFTIKDRVYVKGQRRGGTGTEECVGWLDRIEDLESDSDRFPYFCFASSVGVFSGLHRLSGLKSFEPYSAGATSMHAPNITADLYGDLTDDEKTVLQLLGAVDPEWAKRHER